MPKYVQGPNGEVIEFPSGMPDETINATLQKQFGGNSLTKAYENVRGAVGKVVDFLDDPTGSFAGVKRATGMPPAGEQYNPLPSSITSGAAQTAVGLMPGGAGLVPALGRVGAAATGAAAGAALEGKPVGTEAGKAAAITGVVEAAIPAGSKVVRSLPGMKDKIANAYTDKLGTEITQSTNGVLPKVSTPAELDALVRGSQGAGGKLVTGRTILGDWYSGKIGEADKIISGAQVNVPSLGATPKSLKDAVHDIQNIAAWQSAVNPAMRTVVGRSAREARAQAWGEVDDELRRLDPTGAALEAVREARQTFAIGASFLDAVRKSGAITRGPNEISFDSSKFQRYVSENRGQFISAFANAGAPDAWPRFVNMVYRGGPVGSQDVLARTGSAAEAGQQLLRSGGGAGTTAVLPVRTALPGLGSSYTGTPPGTLPAPGQTLADILGLRALDLPLPRP